MIDPALEGVVEARVLSRAGSTDFLRDLYAYSVGGEKHRRGVIVAITLSHPIVLHRTYDANQGHLVPKVGKNFGKTWLLGQIYLSWVVRVVDFSWGEGEIGQAVGVSRRGWGQRSIICHL